MNKFKFLAAVVTITASLMAGSLQASIVNPGFESGFSGWTLSHPSLSAVVSTYTAVVLSGPAPVYGPQEGSFFARLTAGDAGVYTTVSQLVSLGSGEVISGWAAFDAADYLPYNDDALATVTLSGTTTLFASSVSVVGDYGQTPWTAWSFTAPTAGSYLLEYKVRNLLDSGLSSVALFDADLTVVPEPSTYLAGAMLLLPFGVQGIRRLRNRKQVS